MIFDIIPSVSFGTIAFLIDWILNGITMTLFDYLLVKQMLNFERFNQVRIVIYKHEWRMSGIGAGKEVFSWGKSWFKLCYQKNKVYLLIKWNFQLIHQPFYLVFNLKGAHILLNKLFYNLKGHRYGISLVKTQYGPFAFLYKQWLVLPVIVSLLISHYKKNSISFLNSGVSNSKRQ